jgi:hypothetical protein
MKTAESKYTLVAADLLWGDTNENDDSTALFRAQLAPLTEGVLKVGRYMFLFETKKDYERIYRLQALLSNYGRMALILPIEEELHLVGDKHIEQAIAKACPDLSVYRIGLKQGQ